MGNFKPVDQISDMPRDELCSYCNVKRFSMMQDSPYSAYDNATVRSQYETIAQSKYLLLPSLAGRCRGFATTC